MSTTSVSIPLYNGYLEEFNTTEHGDYHGAYYRTLFKEEYLKDGWQIYVNATETFKELHRYKKHKVLPYDVIPEYIETIIEPKPRRSITVKDEEDKRISTRQSGNIFYDKVKLRPKDSVKIPKIKQNISRGFFYDAEAEPKSKTLGSIRRKDEEKQRDTSISSSTGARKFPSSRMFGSIVVHELRKHSNSKPKWKRISCDNEEKPRRSTLGSIRIDEEEKNGRRRSSSKPKWIRISRDNITKSKSGTLGGSFRITEYEEKNGKKKSTLPIIRTPSSELSYEVIRIPTSRFSRRSSVKKGKKQKEIEFLSPEDANKALYYINESISSPRFSKNISTEPTEEKRMQFTPSEGKSGVFYYTSKPMVMSRFSENIPTRLEEDRKKQFSSSENSVYGYDNESEYMPRTSESISSQEEGRNKSISPSPESYEVIRIPTTKYSRISLKKYKKQKNIPQDGNKRVSAYGTSHNNQFDLRSNSGPFKHITTEENFYEYRDRKKNEKNNKSINKKKKFVFYV